MTKITQEKNALQKTDNVIVMRDIKSSIKELETRLLRIDKEIDKLVTGDKELNSKRQQMESIKGIGRVSANTILIELPEIGSLTDGKRQRW